MLKRLLGFCERHRAYGVRWFVCNQCLIEAHLEGPSVVEKRRILDRLKKRR